MDSVKYQEQITKRSHCKTCVTINFRFLCKVTISICAFIYSDSVCLVGALDMLEKTVILSPGRQNCLHFLFVNTWQVQKTFWSTYSVISWGWFSLRSQGTAPGFLDICDYKCIVCSWNAPLLANGAEVIIQVHSMKLGGNKELFSPHKLSESVWLDEPSLYKKPRKGHPLSDTLIRTPSCWAHFQIVTMLFHT